jgi:hypothetical protein
MEATKVPEIDPTSVFTATGPAVGAVTVVECIVCKPFRA